MYKTNDVKFWFCLKLSLNLNKNKSFLSYVFCKNGFTGRLKNIFWPSHLSLMIH